MGRAGCFLGALRVRKREIQQKIHKEPWATILVSRIASEIELQEIVHRCAKHDELVNALAAVVALHNFSHLDRGIGTSLPDGKMWLAARALVRAESAAQHEAPQQQAEGG